MGKKLKTKNKKTENRKTEKTKSENHYKKKTNRKPTEPEEQKKKTKKKPNDMGCGLLAPVRAGVNLPRCWAGNMFLRNDSVASLKDFLRGLGPFPYV
jgi:hypothetical protein